LRDYITEDERESVSENTSEASIQDMIKDRRTRESFKVIIIIIFFKKINLVWLLILYFSYSNYLDLGIQMQRQMKN